MNGWSKILMLIYIFCCRYPKFFLLPTFGTKTLSIPLIGQVVLDNHARHVIYSCSHQFNKTSNKLNNNNNNNNNNV